jgi:hypothetical protein
VTFDLLHEIGLVGVPPQAKRPEAGATAGATLIPMVMNAHTIAAKAETIWLREKKVMVISLWSPF